MCAEFQDCHGRRPDEARIYEENDDYITAYSMHTDYRIAKYGHASAIGGHWEEHGRKQLDFLKKQGLTPDSTLLDFGCGTGRLARHAVPYLEHLNYLGVDISHSAAKYASDLSELEGWSLRKPHFLVTDDGLIPDVIAGKRFYVIWMHSVFTHLPEDIIVKITKQISKMDFGLWLFTFDRRSNPTGPTRTGIKQFEYPADFFVDICARLGMKAEDIGQAWPGGQSCIRVSRG